MGDRVPASPSDAEVRVLGWGCACAGLLALACVVFPFSPTAPTALNLVLGISGVALGAALVRWSGRVPDLVVHLVLLLATGLMTLSVAASTTPAGRVTTTYGFVWIAVHTAFFHAGRVAAAHVAAIAAGLGYALLRGQAPSALQTWWFVMATVVVVASVLHVLVGRLRALADRDPLTGLLTRRAFFDAAESAMANARRTGTPLTLAVIDLDDFKAINDGDGHAAGDALLAELASSWVGALRRGDLLGRYGGDEFTLLAQRTDEDGSAEILERLEVASGAARWTAGVAGWTGESLPAWIARADADLYTNKRSAHR